MKAVFKADMLAISDALRQLQQATKECSFDDIAELNKAGYIPTPIMMWLKYARCNVTTIRTPT